MDSFEANYDIIEASPHFVTPISPAFPFVIPPPFLFGDDNSDNVKKEESEPAWASVERMTSNHKQQASVDDFMDLIATLEKS